MSDSAGTAIVFPGQGSQKAGMARDFHERSAEARAVYDEASEAAEVDLARISFEEDERLNLTEFTQPAILTAEIAMLRALEHGFDLSADVFAGHSLGEYTALVAAGAMSLGDAVRLVRRRGALMQEAVPPGEGAMLAVIGDGLEIGALRELIEDLEVDPANHNSPSQIVLSGKAADVATARGRLEGEGRRCVPLQVSAPFHSRFMQPTEARFAPELSGVAIVGEAAARVASNYSGDFHPADSDHVKENLVRQIGGTVRWVDDMRAIAARAATIVEIGPGRPLSGFFREIGITTIGISNWRQAEKALAKRVGGGGE